MRLHMIHGFTHAWATDGSLDTKEIDGKITRKVGWGTYSGMQPLAREIRAAWEEQETQMECELWRVQAGMRCGSLPAHCETFGSPVQVEAPVAFSACAQTRIVSSGMVGAGSKRKYMHKCFSAQKPIRPKRGHTLH